MKTNKFNITAQYVDHNSEFIHNVIEHYQITNNRMVITRWIGSSKFGIELTINEK